MARKSHPFFYPQFFIPEALFSPSLTTIHQHKESRSGGQEMPNPVKITEDSNMVFLRQCKYMEKISKNQILKQKKLKLSSQTASIPQSFLKKIPNRNKKIKNRTKLIFS